jgi:hypothetical protein
MLARGLVHGGPFIDQVRAAAATNPNGSWTRSRRNFRKFGAGGRYLRLGRWCAATRVRVRLNW